MDRELFAEITTGNLVYFATVLLVGVVLALAAISVGGRVKSRHKDSLVGQVVEAVDGALGLWIVVTGAYLGLRGLPPLADHLSILRHGFTVVSVGIVVYAGIRVQGTAIAWYISQLGIRTGQAKVLNSLMPMSKQVASIVILSMGVLIILDQLGISIAPLVAGLGIGGLAVALALQGTLTNFFAGLTVTTDGSLRVGDFVELEGGLRGTVDQIGWRTTRIRSFSNNMVVIPNSKLADSIATNYNYPTEEVSVLVQGGVSYFSDLDHVERVTLEVARGVMEDTPGSVREYQPTIWYQEFGDSNINFTVVLRARSYMDSWLLKHNFIKALFHRYNQEGIEISFPARNVFMRSEAAGPPSAPTLQQ